MGGTRGDPHQDQGDHKGAPLQTVWQEDHETWQATATPGVSLFISDLAESSDTAYHSMTDWGEMDTGTLYSDGQAKRVADDRW